MHCQALVLYECTLVNRKEEHVFFLFRLVGTERIPMKGEARASDGWTAEECWTEAPASKCGIYQNVYGVPIVRKDPSEHGSITTQQRFGSLSREVGHSEDGSVARKTKDGWSRDGGKVLKITDQHCRAQPTGEPRSYMLCRCTQAGNTRAHASSLRHSFFFDSLAQKEARSMEARA